MKPAQFEYHDPTTLADALGVLAEHGEEAKPLAGGQSLVPMLALRLTRFEHLVDLNRVDELSSIEQTDGRLVIGAMTRQRALERDEAAAKVPLLRLAAPLIGHFQIRNRGTVGGSVAHADPASELPAVALALDAELEVASRDATRRVPAREFFEGTWMTTIQPDELLTRLDFPVWEDGGFAVEEVARRHGDFALAGAVAAVRLDGQGAIAQAGLALFGVGSTPVRAASAEQAIVGTAAADVDAAEIGAIAASELDPPADIHASAAYRKRVGAYVLERALQRAIEDARP